jgi:molybdate transport system substrate-binding protein
MWRRMSAVVAICVVLAGCGDHAPVDGEITVFAATSLTGAFTDIGRAFEEAHQGAKVRFNFAASSALAQQMENGELTDVFA